MQLDIQTRGTEFGIAGTHPHLGLQGSLGQLRSDGFASAVPTESTISFRAAAPGLSHMFETAVTAGPWMYPITPLERQYQGAYAQVWDAWLSGTTSWAGENEVPMPEPEVIIDVSARPLITDRVSITRPVLFRSREAS